MSSSSVASELRLCGTKWVLSGDPYILYRAEAAIPYSTKEENGSISYPATEETAVELMWFLQRFKVNCLHEADLRRASAKHSLRRVEIGKILAGDFRTDAVNFREGLRPRDYQTMAAMLWRANGGLLCADQLGTGKAQPLDCKVLTPTGWVLMGDLKVGDSIVDPDGGIGHVTGVFEQGVRDVFKVTTNDGRFTRCCDEHLWCIQTGNDRNVGKYRVVQLKDFKHDLYRVYSGQRIFRSFLPLCKPTDGSESWSTDPWLVGYLIGNGTMLYGGVSVSCYDAQCRERIADLLPCGVTMKQTQANVHDYRLSQGQIGGTPNVLMSRLRAVDLAGKGSPQKRIPKSFLRLSYPDRLKLLRGLMDSDGSVGVAGSDVEFTSTSEGLLDDVRELIESLGGFATKSRPRIPKYTYKGAKLEGRLSWRLHIRMPVCPFSLARKADRWKVPYMARSIRSVEPDGRCATRCISVSTKRNLYVTDGYIVTHNTLVSIAGIADRSMLPAIVVSPANLTLQWRNQLDKFLEGFHSHVIYQQRNYDLRVVSTCKECGEAATAKAIAIQKCSYCKGKSFERSLADVYLISYHKMQHWHKELERIAKSVIFDEAQELRRCDSKKYESCKALARKCDYRLLLSGTPCHNFGGEMFNVMDVACPKKLGNKKHFREQWCKQSFESGKEPMLEDPEALSRYLTLNGMMIRRTREEVGREIPDIQTLVHTVDCDSGVYAKMTKDAKELARIMLRLSDNAMVKGQQMRAAGELSAMVRHATGLSKAPYVAQFVRMLLDSGEPVMLFGWHRSVFELWCRELREYAPVLYTGSEGPQQKENAKDKFVRGDTNLLICSLQSGRGLDGIQNRCRVGVFGELDYSPAVHQQAVGRYHRDGQQDNCLTYYLVSEDGSDPLMLESLGIKKGQVDGVIQNTDKSSVLAEREAVDHLKQLAKQFLKAS